MFAKIWRHKWRVLLAFVVAAGGLYYWYYVREPDWRSSAIEDVAFIRDTIAEDHPGTVDAENPAFRKKLDEVFLKASEMAAQVDSPAGYFYATRAMTMPFQDAHLATQFFRELPRERRWPGFLVGYVDEQVKVVHQENGNMPPVGSILQACDGKSPTALYEERVLPFNFLSWLSAYEQGDWPWILIDSGNPFSELPSRCTFLVDSEETEYPMQWAAFDPATQAKLLDPIEPSVENTTGLRFMQGSLAWISIASFFDSGEDVSEELAILIEEISQNRESLAAADKLVIDVRGNSGGASKAGYQVAAAIWGEDFIADRLPYHSRTDWRASKNNLERIDDAMLPLRIQFGADSELYKTVLEIRDGMQAASDGGNPFFKQAEPALSKTGADPLPLPDRVFFLTDRRCVSACLDFADLMLAIEGVTHIGGETAGDSLYLEVVAVDLPSGIGQLVYPTAIHRGRARSVNDSYRPQIPFPGDISDNEALANWVASLD